MALFQHLQHHRLSDISRLTNQVMSSTASQRSFAARLLLLLLIIMGSQPALSTELRFGTNVWPGYEPLHLARKTGHLDNRVKLIAFRSATQVMAALSAGAIEGGALTLEEVLLLTSQGTDMTIVQIADLSDGGDSVFAKPGINSMKALAGQTVVLENSALGEYVLQRASELHGLDRLSLRKRYANANRHEREFAEDDVAGIVTFEPTSTRLRLQGANELFNSSEIKGEIVDVFAFRKEVFDNPTRLAQIQHMLEAWQAALGEIADNPESAYQILGQRMQMSSENTRAAYNSLELIGINRSNTLLSDPDHLPATLSKRAQFMVNNGQIQTANKLPELRIAQSTAGN